MQINTFEPISLNVVESTEHTFLMSSRDVAAGYGVGESVIRDHKKKQYDELIEGTHFIMTRNDNNAKKTMWTKLGVVTLGFFIKSEKAKVFRKWAANYVLNNDPHEPDEDLVQVVLRQNSMIAKYAKEYDDVKKIKQSYTNVRWRVSALVEQTRKHIADQTKLLEILEKDMEIMDMYEEFHGPYELVKPKKQKQLA